MKHVLLATVAVVSSLSLVSCQSGDETPDANTSQAEATQMTEHSVPTFSAKAFFETTTYILASSAGNVFGPTSGDILLTSDESGVWNAYRANPQTGERTQLTNSATNPIRAVSWFPNDERLLYTSDGGGDELDHLYVREGNGSVKDLTPGNPVKAAFLGWSDSGNSFYAMTNERDARTYDVYEYQTSDYQRELIYQNDGLQVDSISSNGQYIALTKNRTSADSDIYLLDLNAATPTPKLITEHEGNIAYSAYGFSADNTVLYYSTNEFGEFAQAWKYDLNSGEKSKYLSADWDVSWVTESPSGNYGVSIVNADGVSKLTLKNKLTGNSIGLKDLPEGNVGSVRFNQDETKIAFTMNGDKAPTNIHVADLKTGKQIALTSALNSDMTSDMLVEGEIVRYKSYDGLKVPGIMYRPHSATSTSPVPGLILVHGGPGGQNRKGYRAMVQHLVNNGYGVYAMNNRGSSGYGKTFFHMDDRKHGDVDLKDVISSKDFMASLDWVDGDKMGIIGGSYGGYMVAAALAFEPEEFDVGINIFGVTNWERTLTSIPPWWESFKEALYDEMGDPATDLERHRAISPLFHAENIVKPLLVVQGANDPRVLQVESDELVEAVRENGVPVEYIVFPDEGHGFRKKSNRITASEAYVRFLDKYLKK